MGHVNLYSSQTASSSMGAQDLRVTVTCLRELSRAFFTRPEHTTHTRHSPQSPRGPRDEGTGQTDSLAIPAPAIVQLFYTYTIRKSVDTRQSTALAPSTLQPILDTAADDDDIADSALKSCWSTKRLGLAFLASFIRSARQRAPSGSPFASDEPPPAPSLPTQRPAPRSSVGGGGMPRRE